MLSALIVTSMLCALVPAALFIANMSLYREPAQDSPGTVLPSISVLIPARDEEGAIAGAVESVLASDGVDLEVIVMNDGSTDRTATIVAALAARDARVRLEQAPSLPAGWNGKQHACWALSHAARHEVLCFVDADVRLEPAALARMTYFLAESRAALVSGFPRQITGTTLEWLLLPLIHFVLLGFLPLAQLRRKTAPSLAAGCGQFLMVRRGEYFASGGHAAIRETMHDGLRLPRLLREHGRHTDLADITNLARCRMYRSAGQVWQGLAKNATEGLAARARIMPVTLFLLLGQVTPFVILPILLLTRHRLTGVLASCLGVAIVMSLLPRFLAAWRYRQQLRSAWAHPIGITVLLLLQWYALLRKLRGGAVSWKARSYTPEPVIPPHQP